MIAFWCYIIGIVMFCIWLILYWEWRKGLVLEEFGLGVVFK
jgi:hypothetical protein